MESAEGVGELLRAWRDRVRPEEVGLPVGAGRRAPGLRREELAALAGVSVDYLVRLEQGRARHPSPPVLGALARALRLTEAESDHLHRAGGVAEPARGLVPRHVPRGVQRVVDRLGDVPIAVFSAAWDLLQQNPLWTVLSGSAGEAGAPGGLERNVAWRHFTRAPGLVSFDDEHAEEFSADLAADLRDSLARYPRDRDLRRLVARLRAETDDFERHWSGVRVARHRSSTKTVRTALVGDVEVDCDVLAVPGSDLRIVVYTVAPGSPDATAMDLLRVTGLQQLAPGGPSGSRPQGSAGTDPGRGARAAVASRSAGRSAAGAGRPNSHP